MLITVFTPTYNRAYIIENLYKSLIAQSFTDFEWLVVDDGSTDNTEQLINSFINDENCFSVNYIKKENGGKCSAINYGLDFAKGKLFLTVDSDDILTPDALEKIAEWEKSLPKDENFCGVCGNLGTSSTVTPNTLSKETFKDGNLLDRYTSFDGEKAIAFYTDIHKKYKYPLFDGEKFITEAVVWNRIAADGYKMRFYNDIICVYEYRDDGLTKAGNKLFLDNPHGYGLWLKEKNEFLGGSKFKMQYSFVCELKDLYSDKVIAECIGTSSFNVKFLKFIHKIISIIKR